MPGQAESVASSSPLFGASVYPMLWERPLYEAIRAVGTAGFGGVEILATSPHLSPTHSTVRARRKVRSALLSEGLRLFAVNAPTLDLNLAAVEPLLRQVSVAYYSAVIDLAADLEAECVVLSPGRIHPLQAPPLEMVRGLSADSLGILARRAEEQGVLISLENLPYGLFERVDDLRWLLNQVPSRSLRLTFDVANAFGIEPPELGLQSAADRLSLIQVSDTTRARWMHAEIGTGEVDFGACWADLVSAGVPVVIEVTQPAGIEPVVRSRQFLLDLDRRNDAPDPGKDSSCVR